MPPLDVLVVDDDAATREGLRELLTRAGFSTVKTRTMVRRHSRK